jgi:hypothetical protein
MFEDHIAHGYDMIRRIEAERKLASPEREALPAYRRVPLIELDAWQKSVETKLSSTFGSDTLARYNTFVDPRLVEVWRMVTGSTAR